MTVINSTRKIRANGDGIVVAFQFSFPAKVATDVVVKKIVNSTGVATTQTVGVDYTIVLNTVTEGGTITYTVAPTALEDSFIIRETVQDQQTALPIGGNFPEISVENEIDRSRLIDIEIQEQLDRSLVTPDTEAGLDLTIPLGADAAGRSSKLWGWNSVGDDLALFSDFDIVSVITVKGDLVQGSDLGVGEQLSIGATNAVLQVVSGKAAWVTNPTILLPTIADFTNATHDHSNTAGGGSVPILDTQDIAGRWDLLESQTASASASIDFDAKLTANYNLYMVVLEAIVPATDATHLDLRFDSNGGASYETAGYAYAVSILNSDAVQALSGSGAGSDNDTTIIRVIRTLGTGSNETAGGVVYIFNPLDTVFTKTRSIYTTFNSAAITNLGDSAGLHGSPTAMDSVQFFMSSGNIASGVFKLYGLRK